MKDLATRMLAATMLACSLLVPDAAFALFFNGGFETGDFSFWNQSHAYNYGLDGPWGCNGPYFTAYYVGVGGGGDQSAVVTAAVPETGVDPDLGAAASLKYPKYGLFAARVNGMTPNYYRNTIVQQATVLASDVDPNDNKVHIRFVFAPVLDAYPANHPPCDRPFVHIHVDKMLGSTPSEIFDYYIWENQPGLPWQMVNGLRFTDWQLADIAFGDVSTPQAIVVPGDVIQLELTGSGCNGGAHHGYVYVDAIDSKIPGLTVVKVANDVAVDPGGTLTYTFTYRNDAPFAIDNVVVTETIPDCATYVSHTNPSTGGSCVPSAGVVTCNVGTLAPGAIGTFTVTVMASTDTSQCDALHNGNYSIEGDNALPTLGPLVTTPLRICVAPPPQTMVGWWPLDEPSGEVAHDLVGAHDGGHLGAVIPIPRLNGLVGQSLNFGQNVVQVPDPPDGTLDFGPENGMGARDFSIDAWIRPTSAVEGDPKRTIVRKGLNAGYALSQFGNRLSLMLMSQAQGGGSREAVSGAITNLGDGEWHFIAVTVDRTGGTTGGALVRFYVDGAFYNSVSLLPLPGTISNDSNLLIGHGEVLSDEFLGGIDEVELFRGVLSAEWIQSVWFARHAGKCKRFCSVPSVTSLCENETFKDVPLSLHNPSPSSMACTLAGVDMPAGFQSGGQTSSDQMSPIFAANFSAQSPTVSPNDVDVVTLHLDRPGGFNLNGDKAAYRVDVTTSSELRSCIGFLAYTTDTCLSVGTVSNAVGVGAPAKTPFTIGNGSIGPKSYDLEWSVQDSYGQTDRDVVSLGTLPPGQRLTRNVVVPAGGTAVETVTVTPLVHDGVRAFDVVMRADLNGDGEAEPVTSWNFHTVLPPAELMPGRQMSVGPGKVQFLAKPDAGSTFALPGADDDPRVEGGSLEVFDTNGPGSNTYPLPAGGWTGLGRPAGSKGYRFRGTAADACRLVLMKKKTVKALCRSSAVTLPLPFVGDAGVVLAIGSDTQRYCATFGGTISQNDVDRFRSKDAPALDRCSTSP